MGNTPTTVTLFEGIATVDVGGDDHHDAYMAIRAETVGQSVRWFGSFTWMGEAPKTPFHDGVLAVSLSDGRDCLIRVPHPPVDGEELEFLGFGALPGFYWLGEEPTREVLELAEVEVARWRVWCSRVLGVATFGAFLAAIWWQDYRGPLVMTGCLLGLVSTILPARRAGKRLPEVPLDVPRQ